MSWGKLLKIKASGFAGFKNKTISPSPSLPAEESQIRKMLQGKYQILIPLR